MKNFEIYSAPSESGYDSGYEGVYDQFVFYDEEDECEDELIGDECEESELEDEEEDDDDIEDEDLIYCPGNDEIGVS